jgi:dTDP-4-dehydrorhamnose 3,5-epimerase-like enzyme
MRVPVELDKYFDNKDFSGYPLVRIPQEFSDSRGIIRNLADGVIGDIAIISSVAGAVRANHIHSNDWHLCYLVHGSMEYLWKDQDGKRKKVIFGENQMIFTPPLVPHKMVAVQDSTFISVSRLSRISSNYEADTKKLDINFFEDDYRD